MKRDLIDITDLSVEEIDELIAKAEDIIENPENYREKWVNSQDFALVILRKSGYSQNGGVGPPKLHPCGGSAFL